MSALLGHAQSLTITTLAGSAGSSGSTDGMGSAARFSGPYGVAVDASGNVYVADYPNHTIRKVTPAGVVTTLAGSAGSSGSTDGTGSAARFYYPYGVAVDASGNLYVADSYNHTIRKVTAAGVVTTLAGSAGNSGSTNGTGSAARFNLPWGVAVDTGGNVYVADNINATIRKVTAAGVVTTLAGSAGGWGSADGTGTVAQFYAPQGVAVDTSGNMYVVDYLNYTIRKVTAGGVVTTPAGSAGNSGSADGTGTVARFNNPSGVAVDTNGNVYVGDRGNYTIRKGVPNSVPAIPTGVSASDGTYSGRVVVSWSSATNATGYTVWRYTASDSSSASQLGSSVSLSYDDTTAPAGARLYYWVKATNAVGASGFSGVDSGWAAAVLPAAPTGVTASTNFTNRVSVSWTAVSGLTDYLVWRNTANNSSGASYLSNAIGTSPARSATLSVAGGYDDTTASPDMTYYYWVQTWSGWGVSAFSSSAMGLRLSTISSLSAPSSVQATDGVYTNRVRVTWTPVSGATSYEVWGGLTNDTGAASLKGETADTAYDDTAVTPGICVYYRVKSRNASDVSVFSSPDVGFARLGGNAADLALANFTFLPRALAPGANPTSVTFQLSNNGPANMASAPTNTRYLVEFYLSTNATFGDLDDRWIGEYVSDVTLNSGMSLDLTLSETARSGVLVPSTLNGVYVVFARVDHTSPSTLLDTDGNNNVVVRSGTVQVGRRNDTWNDYDGDGQSDLAVFRPFDAWYFWSFSSGMIGGGQIHWGGVGSTPVVGEDHTGDGISDLAVFDSISGYWYIRTMSGAILAWEVPWGWPGAITVPGDYDGDGISDLAVFDSNLSFWYIRTMNGSTLAEAVIWGFPGAIPVSGDYDGDWKNDLAVYDSNTGYWYIGNVSGNTMRWEVLWGGFPGAIPVSGDYDGDGVDDLAIFDAGNGNWYILTLSGTVLAWALPWGWGGSTAIPVPGDYDGDAISDLALYDSRTGNWYIQTLSGTVLAWEVNWGFPGGVNPNGSIYSGTIPVGAMQ